MKQKTARSFIHAFSGLGHFFRHERNGQIQAVLGICALSLAAWFHVSSTDWVLILLCTGSVLALEMLNSALEKLCDFIQPEPDPRIKIIKDMAAGAVLWASLISALIGAIIFLPEIGKLL